MIHGPSRRLYEVHMLFKSLYFIIYEVGVNQMHGLRILRTTKMFYQLFFYPIYSATVTEHISY